MSVGGNANAVANIAHMHTKPKALDLEKVESCFVNIARVSGSLEGYWEGRFGSPNPLRDGLILRQRKKENCVGR